jgi:hypothetical protein
LFENPKINCRKYGDISFGIEFEAVYKNDKIECIKKNNIQKSVSWCEKYKIPCNKFTEKINI